MLKKFFGNNSDLALVIGVIAILAILFAPVPPYMLDLFIIMNFALALTILLLTFYVQRPVDFSTFPALLLIATLFRLSLNVAATRLILTGADAGAVIGSIGEFAVQGNYIIGLVVFFILVVVQYVVVTAGAQRVSEVAARFVLDSVPGQQMSIDADLNMGLIDQNEAKRRRKDLEREASFYGAMDGASKFVKGDAIAGIIILLIDIIAGWIIGVAQMGMAWDEALARFTLLTIGDGIVTQVPALIIAVATGIIVTRSSADRQLSTEVFSQLVSVPKIPLIVLAALLLLLALPGMPKWPIGLLALVAGAAFFASRRRAHADQEQGLFEEDRGDDMAKSASRPPPVIEVALGGDLGDAWRPMTSVLTERIAALRIEREQLTGFLVPAVVFQHGQKLDRFAYEIRIHGARYAAGTLQPDLTLAIRSQETDKAGSLEGIETRDPAFGLPAIWIDDAHIENARQLGHSLIDPVTVLITHLGEVIRTESALLLSRADVVGLLEGVRSRQPGLIEELIPAILTVSDVQRILQNLLAEEVSIRPIDQIVEALADIGRNVKDHAEVTELVRQRLSHLICDILRGRGNELSVLSLDPRVEGQIADSIRRADGNGLVLDPRTAEQLLKNLIPQVEMMIKQQLAPVLLCSSEIRRHLRAFTRRNIPRLSIVSVNEIPNAIDLRSFSIIKLDP